jgi:hypothetical protein
MAWQTLKTAEYELDTEYYDSYIAQHAKWDKCDDVHAYLVKRKKRLDETHEIIKPRDLLDEIAMSYDDYANYLVDKYGPAPCDYFSGSQCSFKNEHKINRMQEGLFCHHRAEECKVDAAKLTDAYFCKHHREVVMADNFVYCNFIEHLLLHMKIALDDAYVAQETSQLIDFGGAKKIWREINAYYGNGTVIMRNKKAAELVQDQYDKYISIMKFFKKFLAANDLFKYCPEDDLSEDQNGVQVFRILEDLSVSDANNKR